jgi:death-on-curing protein
MSIRYLSLAEVIGLHAGILELTGSPASPLLRPGDLLSAMERPRNAAFYESADLIRQAVLLGVGISQSQAFLDGNKRVAFAAADVFLRINGFVFLGDSLELAYRLESIAEASHKERDARIDDLESWLRPLVQPVVSDESA